MAKGMRREQVKAAVLAHLRVCRRGVPLADLTVAVHGMNDNGTLRRSVSRAAQELAEAGEVVTRPESVRDGRGHPILQTVVYLPEDVDRGAAAAPQLDAEAAAEEMQRAMHTPRAHGIVDSRGRIIAFDHRADHLYCRQAFGENQLCAENCPSSRKDVCEFHPKCDEQCRANGCVEPTPVLAQDRGRWDVSATPSQAQLRLHPAVRAHYDRFVDPVIITPDGETHEALPGCSVFDVIEAWRAEHPKSVPV
jgi:hypothetical protein